MQRSHYPKTFLLILGMHLLLFLFSGCERSNAKRTIATAVATHIPSLTASATFLPALSYTPTPTKKSGHFSSDVTVTSAPTEVIIPTSFDLPAWIGEPQIDVLASLKWTDLGIYVSLLNASTGAVLDLPLGPNLREYFWVDNMHFGFLTHDRKTMYLVDMKTGNVKTEILRAETTRLLVRTDYYGGLAMIRTSDEADGFIFAYSETENIHYIAEDDTSLENIPITVTNRDSGEVIWVSNFKDSLYNYRFSWSPVKDSYLAILRGEIDYDMQRWDMRSLVLIDVLTGNIKFQSRGDFTGLSWSPDGSKIIVERGFKNTFQDGLVGTGYKQIPCIIYLSDGHIKCLSNVSNSNIPANTIFDSAISYSWDPNGMYIRFMYVYGPQDVQDRDHVQLGNLCIYNLLDGKINCPTENLAALTGRGIQGYEFSPGGQYAYFCYSTAGHGADYVGDENDAVINIDGTGFITWKAMQTREWTLQCTLSANWRPLP